jgi:hypothetical protein
MDDPDPDLLFHHRAAASHTTISVPLSLRGGTMHRTLVLLTLVAALLLPECLLAQKNVYGGTGKVRFRMNRAGSFALYDKDFVTQLSRASLVVALDSAHVFDYEQDAMYLTTAGILSSVGKADTILTALFDNTWQEPPPPPDVQVIANAYGWKNDSFSLVDYKLTNMSAASYTVHIGMGCVPYPSETWGGETVVYDTTKKMVYFYREGEPAYIGVKLLGQNPTSFHVLDWDVYSPDPSNDMATDSTRWRMTALPGFDAPLIAGVDGSFFNLNFGTETIDPRASVYYTVAYLFSTTEDGLRAMSDSAEVRNAQLQAASSVKNAYGGTGVVSFKLNRAGSLAMYSADGTIQLDRASLLVARDSAHVFDYEEDAYYTMAAPALSVGGKADTVATAIFDNTWQDPPPPPDVRVLEEVHAWKNDPFVLADYTITNYAATATAVHIGMGCVPYPSETYGGETVAYDSVKKMAYYFREGEAPYIGVKLIGMNPVSFHALDWDVYSPDPNADMATDSTRWRMTALPGFDTPLVGGVDGSFFNLNFGTENINARSSVSYTVAYLYSTSLAGLRAASDAAELRYNISLAVEPAPVALPQGYALQQNYPNPFNPSTTINCQLPVAGKIKLVVYDLLGREVATLADGHYPAGQHSFRFDGGRLSSGVYFCRLMAGSFVSTTKMILQK